MDDEHAVLAGDADANGWSAEAEELLARVAEHVPRLARGHAGNVTAALDKAVASVLARLSEAADARRRRALIALLSDLLTMRDRRRQADDARRLEAVRRVRNALSQLRTVPSVQLLLKKAMHQLCDTCGFERAVLFRVDGSLLRLEDVYIPGAPERAAREVEFGHRTPVQMDHTLLETELLRRRTAALVRDPLHDPRTEKRLVGRGATTSYVAAPIMAGERVIGFLHADYCLTGRAVDELDRDLLWAFVEGLGYAIQRAALLQRLRQLRTQVENFTEATQAAVAELVDATVELGSIGAEAPSGGHVPVAPAPVVPSETRLRSLLSPRELEVLELMAQGATNAQIADQLVISDGTAKSHVKHVLRKLRAKNRSEAVARYLKITLQS